MQSLADGGIYRSRGHQRVKDSSQEQEEFRGISQTPLRTDPPGTDILWVNGEVFAGFDRFLGPADTPNEDWP